MILVRKKQSKLTAQVENTSKKQIKWTNNKEILLPAHLFQIIKSQVIT